MYGQTHQKQGGHTKNPPQKTHPGFFKKPIEKKPKGFRVFMGFLKIIKISHSNLRIKTVFTQRLGI